MSGKISKEIRQDIFDAVNLDGFFFGGQLGDSVFLSRIFDLNSLPSYDSRYPNAGADIYMHCEYNDDWEKNWVFSDQRFSLLNCIEELFLKFLCEMVHPLVRPDKSETTLLVSHFNEQLETCGWQLVETGKIAGRSRYEARKTTEFHSQIDRARTSADILTSNLMQVEISRINTSIETDPASAIGTSIDLVESRCKAILEELQVKVEKSDDLPTLSKKMCRELGLLPEGIPSEAKGAEIIKRTLSNLTAITKGIAELRGLYGSGHGRGGKHVGLQPRHARLAASCAITFVDFATETYMQRKTERSGKYR